MCIYLNYDLCQEHCSWNCRLKRVRDMSSLPFRQTALMLYIPLYFIPFYEYIFSNGMLEAILIYTNVYLCTSFSYYVE